MNRRSVQQIAILFGVCMLLVSGLMLWSQNVNKGSDLLRNSAGEVEEFNGPFSAEALQADKQTITNSMNPTAVFTTNNGAIEIELFENQMPVTVANFTKLAEEGFYNGTKFHRIIDGFMIQGGDPNSKGNNTSIYGQGGPGYTIQDEFVADDNLSNVRGSISMANTGQPNSGGSQFFINTVDNLGLDFNKEPLSSKHPVFGHVVKGIDIIDVISKLETGQGDVPVNPVIIESITIMRTEG